MGARRSGSEKTWSKDIGVELNLPMEKLSYDPSKDPFLGQTVGKVKIERLIGRGGKGSVYVGEHVTLQKRLAVNQIATRSRGQ